MLDIRRSISPSGLFARALAIFSLATAFGSIAVLLGEPLILSADDAVPYLETPEIRLGDIIAGTTHDISVFVANPGTTPLRVVGGTRSCSNLGCILTDPTLPRMIPARSTASIPIRLVVGGAQGPFMIDQTAQFDEQACLYLGASRCQTLVVRITAAIHPAPSED